MSRGHARHENTEIIKRKGKGGVVFVDTPQLEPYGDRYRLVRGVLVKYRTEHGEFKVTLVPEGFITDGASIPRILWEEVGSPFDPRFITAAIVHDYMCVHDYDVNEMSDLFFLLLRRNGVSLPKALTMDLAVRAYKSVF